MVRRTRAEDSHDSSEEHHDRNIERNRVRSLRVTLPSRGGSRFRVTFTRRDTGGDDGTETSC